MDSAGGKEWRAVQSDDFFDGGRTVIVCVVVMVMVVAVVVVVMFALPRGERYPAHVFDFVPQTLKVMRSRAYKS